MEGGVNNSSRRKTISADCSGVLGSFGSRMVPLPSYRDKFSSGLIIPAGVTVTRVTRPVGDNSRLKRSAGNPINANGTATDADSWSQAWKEGYAECQPNARSSSPCSTTGLLCRPCTCVSPPCFAGWRFPMRLSTSTTGAPTRRRRSSTPFIVRITRSRESSCPGGSVARPHCVPVSKRPPGVQ